MSQIFTLGREFLLEHRSAVRMSALTKQTKSKGRHLPLGPQPSVAIGACIRAIRKERKLTLEQVAEKIGSYASQISLVEGGDNVESQWYERIAVALKFKSAYEMLASGGDAQTRKLLRLWRALPDDEARTDVLKLVQNMIVDELERDAT